QRAQPSLELVDTFFNSSASGTCAAFLRRRAAGTPRRGTAIAFAGWTTGSTFLATFGTPSLRRPIRPPIFIALQSVAIGPLAARSSVAVAARRAIRLREQSIQAFVGCCR
ncbi:MAG TPA: hypothetical protein VFB96_20695, partial [Pirellulaceae bacterium]|nr:hypothetical protein [Pirellulaceae bacterium]